MARWQGGGREASQRRQAHGVRGDAALGSAHLRSAGGSRRGARVLLRAFDLGVNHIDTSDYYGPYVVNDLIRETLHPYAPELVIVTKVGARRDDKGDWLPAFSPDEIRSAVHDNLGRLGLERIGGVNLRLMDPTSRSPRSGRCSPSCRPRG